MSLVFPKKFTLGVATASYQIEGGWNEDGKGESIWDRFSHTPGHISNDDTGDIACDHYHRWREDVNLMKDLGVKAYRFSIAWPRILPNGRGSLNQPGLDFYNRLVDALLEAKIEPFVTLYHWDLPQCLQDEGGWTNRNVIHSFCEFADAASRALGDRVKNWITFNEPWVTAFIGHRDGIHAPGHTDTGEALQASHHQLLSHGLALPILRRNCPDGNVGITLNLTPQEPASLSLADQEAATWTDGYINRWFLDPLAGRGYPRDLVEDYGTGLEFVQPGDLQIIATPIDFLGINNYTRGIVRSGKIDEKENAPRTLFPNPDHTTMYWEVYPQGLLDILERLHRDYSFPAFYITENGASFEDEVNSDGKVEDPQRLNYLRQHLMKVHQAIESGIPVKGYFAWSLLDNFEWSFGYAIRFGLVYVDYATQKRIPKSSALWYRQVMLANQLD